ncbi:MAG TPA: hypothetical protein VEZ70_04595 [Allosphingosinicella sp.]|jgi:hypothetical protein|nr:hypothetical protein [Allosphingosinicella sp.]
MSRKLLRRIERYLHQTRTAPTTFGRLSARDPRLVFDMRMGREPRRNLRRRIEHYLDGVEPS